MTETLTPLISVLHPVRSMEGAEEHKARWLSAAARPAFVEWLTMNTGADVVTKTNLLAAQARGRVLLWVADDLYPCDGWDSKVLESLPEHKPAVLSIPDGFRSDDLPTHPAITREWYEREGCFWSPEFAASQGMYCDNDLRARAQEAGCFMRATGFALDHRHWLRTGAKPTTDQSAMNSNENYARGFAIYKAKHPAVGWGNIALGVRMGRTPNPSWVWSWTRLLVEGVREDDVILEPAVGMPHAVAANRLVKRFLATDCDTLCLLDDDMVFPPNTLERLRADDGGCDVLAGLSVTRNPPHSPIILERCPTDETPNGLRIKAFRQGSIVECDVVGLAFTLIKRRHLVADCFAWVQGQGEDGAFCGRVQASGGRVGCHTGVTVGHRAEVTVHWEDKEV